MPTDTTEVREDRKVAATRIRGVRIEDRLWAEAQATAKAQGENVADAIRRALSAYNADPNAFDAAIAAIRGGAQNETWTKPAGATTYRVTGHGGAQR